MKERNFIKHFAVIGAGTMLNMLLGLFTTPLITRIVDPKEYGQFSIFTMYSGIAVMVLCMGLDQALVRYYYEKDNLDYKRSLLFRCIKLPVAVCAGVSIIFIFLSRMNILNFEFNTIIAVFLCLFTIIQLIYRFSLLLVRLSYQSKIYSGLSLINRLAYIAVALPLLILIKDNDLLLLVISTTIAAFTCMLGSIVVQREVWNFSESSDSCNVSRRELYKYGFPFILSMGLTTVFQAIDKMSLNYYCTYSDVGIYSSTMTLVNIFAIIQTTFNTLWAPMATEHFTNNSKDKSFYQKGNQVITVLMFFCGISLILCKDVFAVLLGEKYRAAAYILPFLIFHPIMYTISETTVMGISFMKKSKMHIVVAGLSCVTNIIGNTILVPIYGCRGAAISTGISYIVFFALRTFIANRYFYINFHLGKFYALTLIASIYALYNTFVNFNIGSILGFMICLLAIVVLYKQTVVWIGKYIWNYKNKIMKRYKF